MNFGWINVFGILIIVVMLVPNIIYAIKNKDLENRYNNKVVNWAEQIGRYASMGLTVFPVGVAGFDTDGCMLAYLIGNSVLLVAYLGVWVLYFQRKTLQKALLLAIIPTIIFLLCGVTLKHPILIISSVIFGISHILITYKNNCPDESEEK